MTQLQPPEEGQFREERIKYLSQEQVQKFFSRIKDKRDKAMFNLIYKYGLRASEVGLLTRDDIDWERGKIRIRRLKGGVSGEYGLYSDSARLLRAYLQERDDFYPYLFLSKKKRPISRKQLDFLFKRYVKKARLSEEIRNVHSLRHSIAVHMLDSGQTQEAVKDFLGHRKIQSTDIYARISNPRREQIFRELERSRQIVKVE